MQQQALELSHDDRGHQGQKRTLSQLQERCFWPGIARYSRPCLRALPEDPQIADNSLPPSGFNSTMHKILRTLPESDKASWPRHLRELVYFNDTTPHSSTEQSPFTLLYARAPTLPLDILLAPYAKIQTDHRPPPDSFAARTNKLVLGSPAS
ncbi:Pol polyprotein [Elysia marginata]|uniref:Pol polyprotein n=1 Tax=Elysia marginata TaxID=1093978 RepID=A0AAV4GQ41_9GAST|nr:Pol polyprotein [Elysia marginata]